MRVLFISGSLRADSLNRKLLACAVQACHHINSNNLLENLQADSQTLDLKTLQMPIYDGDTEAAGIPLGVSRAVDQLAQAKAVVISSPEYNGSVSSALKTFVDWTSRVRPMPWKDKPVLLLGASPGALGAVRGLWHTRVPFEALGCHVYPDMLGLPRAHEAFESDGSLKDPKFQERLEQLLLAFLKRSRP